MCDRLPMPSVHITTKVVCSIPVLGKVYSTQVCDKQSD